MGYKELVQFLWDDFEKRDKMYMKDSGTFVKLCLKFGIKSLHDEKGFFGKWVKALKAENEEDGQNV